MQGVKEKSTGIYAEDEVEGIEPLYGYESIMPPFPATT